MATEDAFSYRLEILKKELDTINESIRKIDDIGNSIKNWSILAWTGSVTAILTKPELYSYILFTAIIPIVFMFTDAHWRKIQRRFAYRQLQIGEFLNSSKLEEAFETKKLDFDLLDPIARNAKSQESFKQFIAIPRILSFPTVSLVYLGLSFVSILLAILLRYFPPL